jgi:cytochrome c
MTAMTMSNIGRAGMVTMLVWRLIAQDAVASESGCPQELAAKAWSKCIACHSVDPGETGKLGPNLHGLFNRKAGSLEGYVYSPAMSKADFEWTPALLDVFLQSPQKAVPNNRMPFAGLGNAKERAALVCRLSETAK